MSDDPGEAARTVVRWAPAHEFRKTHAISGRSSSQKVGELMASMTRKGWSGPPVIVVEYAGDKYVLDGHHRIYAARKAGISVQYRCVNAEQLKDFGFDSVEQVVIAHAEGGYNRIRFR